MVYMEVCCRLSLLFRTESTLGLVQKIIHSFWPLADLGPRECVSSVFFLLSLSVVELVWESEKGNRYFRPFRSDSDVQEKKKWS